MRLLIALLALLFTAAPAAAQEDWTGDWQGALVIPSGQLRLVLSVSRGADGALTAGLESVDQAPGQRIPVSDMHIADGRMTFTIPMINARYEGTWQPERRTFLGTFTQGGQLPLEFSRGRPAAAPVVPGLDGRWEGSIARNEVPLRLILRITTTAAGTIALLDSPDLMANGLAVAELARSGDTVSFTVPGGGSRFRGRLAEGRLAGIWSRTGFPDAEVAFTRTAQIANAPPARPQLPRPPFPYRSEEVRIPNPAAPGVTLAGTLTLPEGSGPFPAAILISGSGAQDRDESLMGHKPFAVLADHLTRQGIAVLRYDDRGIAQSTGSFQGATSADFATDANTAFAFLAARPEIDRRAIGFIGHSEGGMVGPIAATANADVAYLVLLAGPGIPTTELLEGQRRAIGRLQGLDATAIERMTPMQTELARVSAGPLGDAEARAALGAWLTDARLNAVGVPLGQREALIAQFLDPWFRWFLRYDPAPALRHFRGPLLAINGGLDSQVIAGPNLAGIRAATAGHSDVTVTELPGLNHLFQTARTGAPGEYATIEETFSPAAMTLVSDWIRQRFIRR